MRTKNAINRNFVAKTKMSTVGQIILACVAIFTAWPREEIHWTIAFLGSIVLLNLGRALMLRIYPRFEKKDEDTWYWGYVALTTLSGIGWGLLCACLMIIVGKTDDISLMVMINIAGLSAGATTTLTPDRMLARAFVFAANVPTLCALFFIGDPSYVWLGAVITMFLVFLYFQINVHSKMMSELSSRRNQLAAFADATLEAIIVHENGNIIEVNDSYEKMFQYTKSEVVGRNLFDLMPAEVARKAREAGFQEGLTPLQGVGYRKDGTSFDIEYVGRWFMHEGKQVRVTCIQDITSRKQAEAAIAEREKIALESAKTKSQFLANMSHEIRTPLNAIIGITDLLTETAASDLQKKYFRTMKDSGEALLGLVNDILDFSKIDEKKMELEYIEFNLAAAIEGQVDLMANRARQKHIALQILLDPMLPVKVRGDYGRFGQVLLNLVSNALKFTEQGHISVKANVLAQTPDFVRMRFEVQDTGPGISDENAARLFQPFTQADSSTARKHGGTGLGLSISQKIVEMMNGTIGFESELGKGTTFWFEIPFPVVEAKSLAQTYKDKPHSDQKVVVITDDIQIQDVLSCYLESWEFPVEYKTLAQVTSLEGVTTIVASGDPLDVVVNKLKDSTAAHTQVIVIEKNGDHNFHENKFVKASLPLPVRYSDLFNAINSGTAIPLQKEGSESEPKQYDFTKRRILIAEDNSTNQLIILSFLRHFGLQCHAVGNGIEAVDAFSHGEYDLIFMDCQMPELDGYEATKRIRDLEKNGDTRIPIVALTANALKEDRERCLACGMDDFLSKPIRKEKLIVVLETYLKG